MPPVPELQRLAGLIPGEPPAVLRRLLTLVCDLLDMDLAWAAVLSPDDRRTVLVAVRRDGTAVPALEGRSGPLSRTWCSHLVDQDVVLLDDVTTRPELQLLAPEHDVASYAGVALRDQAGRPVGALCAFGHQRHAGLTARDRDVLRGLGDVAAPLVLSLPAAAAGKVPQPREAPDLSAVADAVVMAQDVEQLSRPLLDALHDLTGLASSYLTVIHEDHGVQEVRYSRNTREGFTLPEGLVVPWADTLCKRALEEGRPCTTDVQQVWGDSQAAADLGIQVYVSVPVSLSDGRVWGTLCAADSQQATRVDEHLPTMRLFARLIASQVEQEAVVAHEREQAAQARAEAETDPLTRCGTRRLIEPWLTENLATLGPHEAVLAVYVDVDRFKEVNDRWGHAAGDAVLAEVGLRLFSLAKPGDLVARLGGDEFLVAARLPRPMAAVVADRYCSSRALTVPWGDTALEASMSVGTAVSQGHTPAELVAAADRAMYAAKRGEDAGAGR